MAASPATEVKNPARLPSPTHHVIVKLETIHVPLPDVDMGSMTHELIGYEYTRPSEVGVVAARAWPASVLVTTTVPINKDTLGEAPYLRLVTLHNTMMDHDGARTNPWRAKGSMSSLLLDAEGRPPHTCGNEVVGMIGYGPIGQRVAKMCRALGMEVLVAARKDATPSSPAAAVPRVPFDEVLRRATVLFLVVPLTPDTRNLISGRELSLMRSDAVVVNVGRGGTVDEAALLAALRAGEIAGAATDVFEVEPAGSGQDSVLLGDGARGVNLTLTPHLAWCADQTRVNIRRVVGENIRQFTSGEKGANVVLDMR
ncbi:putative D-isomer specific 2-hydroxyacid dehydrogenase [Colletotrichum sublineola]|uniref:Putative D-isomer specific 2-hydroxyacid dehydrogenase n=1 Tax=Colletotrichum sublineola TaxID=1173701 RepID=A0A066XC86_COLSU|nr:putative D-isomer specific 2-hydroxyacid dehydrogenase [Colletotrichum sublineola]